MIIIKKKTQKPTGTLRCGWSSQRVEGIAWNLWQQDYDYDDYKEHQRFFCRSRPVRTIIKWMAGGGAEVGGYLPLTFSYLTLILLFFLS